MPRHIANPGTVVRVDMRLPPPRHHDFRGAIAEDALDVVTDHHGYGLLINDAEGVARLRDELVQVAAVCVARLELLARA